MSYNDLIDRTGAAGEIPAQIAQQIVGDIGRASTALSLGRSVPTTTRDSRIPVITNVPDAYWVSGDTGLKQTTSVAWENQALAAEEMATIVVVPDNVIADSEFDVWGAVRPLVARAFARKLDRAVVFGEGAPASWGPGLVPAAAAAGNVVLGSEDPIADLMDAAEQVANVEHVPTGAIVRPGWQYLAARTRSEVEAVVGSPVGAAQPFPLTVAGLGIATDPVYWNRAKADAVVADWDSVLLGIRSDISFETFNSGVIQDDTGKIVVNLLQQDATAMRCVMRVGYLLATPAGADGDAGVPVSVVEPIV